MPHGRIRSRSRKSPRDKTQSACFGQRWLRRAWAFERAEQPHGPDDLSPLENAHQLGNRQFGVAVGGHKVVGELALRGAHRLQNCGEFFFHTAYSMLVSPAV